MDNTTYEAYEDGAGRLYIFGIDGDDAAWYTTYYGEEREAGQDWVALMVHGVDPIADGWEMPEGDAGEIYDALEARQIAGSDWNWLPMGIDVKACGLAGRDLAESAGAAIICPECGEVLPGKVKLEGEPTSVELPETCECCGSSLK